MNGLRALFSTQCIIPSRNVRNLEGVLGVNSYRKAEDLLPIASAVRIHCVALLNECLHAKGSEKVLSLMDEISNNLCSVMDLATCIRALHPHLHYKRIAGKVLNYLRPILLTMNTQEELYKKLKELTDDPPNEEARLMRKSFCRDFELHGVGRGMVNAVSDTSQKIEYLTRVFEASGSSEGCDSVYASLNSLLKARHDLAQMTGFSTFAAMTLKERYFSTPQTVLDMLHSMYRGIDLKVVPKNFPHESIPEYFIDQLLEGFGRFVEDAFNLKMNVSSCKFHWASGIIRLDFNSNDDKHTQLGTVFLDLRRRQNKMETATYFPLRGTKRVSHNIVYQIVDAPQTSISLISVSINELEAIPFFSAQTIFHELGHALHSVLSNTHYQTLSGTRCSLEVAEFPSLCMELLFENSEFQSKYFNEDKKDDFFGLVASVGEHHFKETIDYSIFDILLHSASPIEENSVWISGILEKNYQHSLKPSQLHHMATYGSSFYSYPLNRKLAQMFIRHRKDWDSFKLLLQMGGMLSIPAILDSLPSSLRYELLTQHDKIWKQR